MAATAEARPEVGVIDLKADTREILNRWPAVGLAVGVVGRGGLESFHAEGFADMSSRARISEDTIFRIASVTKTFYAIAVMQLWEQGLVDLDAPANDYLRAFKLVPRKPNFRPATLRHLLTHTAGISEVLHWTDLLHIRSLGETSKPGHAVLPPAQRYRGRLRFDADPGTRFMYTNHGFAALGQIIEDVSGRSLNSYLKEQIFGPLGMTDTSLMRSELDRSRFAAGYELRSRGPEELADYEGGGINSTPRDMACFLAALLGDGSNEQGTVLKPATLRMMLEPHYQPDPRIPGNGLGVFLARLGGHLAVEHDGILPGFDATILLAPDDGVGVMMFANGAKRGMHWLVPEASAVLRKLISVPEEGIRTDVPQHPELWPELCGWYHFSAALTDPGKLAIGPGVEVYVRRGQLMIRALSVIPAMYRGFALHPDDDRDPYVFRIAVPWFGIGTGRVIFSREPSLGVTAVHTDFGPLTFHKRADAINPKRWIRRTLGVAAALCVVAALRLRKRRHRG